MEWVLSEHISEHVKEKQLTGSTQHWLTKSKSMTSLVAFYTKITSFVDKTRDIDIVYLNFLTLAS